MLLTGPSLPKALISTSKLTAPINSGSRENRRWISRRNALKSLLAGGGLALGWSIGIEPFWLEISHRQLVVPNLPSSWVGKRLVHISDLHVGRTNQEHLLGAMRQVNELKPDLLVITGDFVDRDFAVDSQLDEVLEVLKPAEIASLACLGNHDFGDGWSDLKVADQVTDSLARHQIRTLRNQSERIDGVDFFGLEDFWSPLFEPAPILDRSEIQRPSFCLCHNPDAFDAADWSRFRGVIFAGHTHGGQCKPPFLPPPLLPVNNRKYVAGMIDLSDGKQMFISRGVGYSLRARFNCRPEITAFHLA